MDDSLKRLGTDWIDLYYMHRDDETTPVEETLATMARLIDSGKILHYGVSNFRAWRMARLVETAAPMGIPPPVACQPPYSAVTRGIETRSCRPARTTAWAPSPTARWRGACSPASTGPRRSRRPTAAPRAPTGG